jgi:cytochrome c biogenesis protein CcmG/thiol:disulfide interchange protein DsbE
MKSPLKYLVFFAPLGVFAALIAVFLVQLGKDPSKLPSALLNKPVPGFELPSLAQGLTNQSVFSTGKPVVMNVFASWCQPCWAEHDVVTQLAQSGVPVIGLAYKDTPEALGRFLKQLGNPYTRVILDDPGRTAIEFGVYGAPETYIIDGKGIIRYRYVGALTPQAIDQEIKPLLASLEQEAA